MRTLLTGHQGYMGTIMAPILTAAGHNVEGLDAGLFADCIAGSLQVPDIKGLSIDLRDVALQHLEDFDAVVHLAVLLSQKRAGILDAELRKSPMNADGQLIACESEAGTRSRCCSSHSRSTRRLGGNDTSSRLRSASFSISRRTTHPSANPIGSRRAARALDIESAMP